MATEYWQKLKDPRWQRRRLEIMQRADFKCENCECEDATLNVHHKLYRKGANPWEYQDHELECLCERCHERHHETTTSIKNAMALLWYGENDVVLGYVLGRSILGNPEPRIVVENYEVAMGVGDAYRVTAEQVVEMQKKHGFVSHGLLWAIKHPKASH